MDDRLVWWSTAAASDIWDTGCSRWSATRLFWSTKLDDAKHSPHAESGSVDIQRNSWNSTAGCTGTGPRSAPTIDRPNTARPDASFIAGSAGGPATTAATGVTGSTSSGHDGSKDGWAAAGCSRRKPSVQHSTAATRPVAATTTWRVG